MQWFGKTTFRSLTFLLLKASERLRMKLDRGNKMIVTFWSPGKVNLNISGQDTKASVYHDAIYLVGFEPFLGDYFGS